MKMQMFESTLHTGHSINFRQKPKKINLQKDKEGIKMDSFSSDKDKEDKTKKRRLFVHHPPKKGCSPPPHGGVELYLWLILDVF